MRRREGGNREGGREGIGREGGKGRGGKERGRDEGGMREGIGREGRGKEGRRGRKRKREGGQLVCIHSVPSAESLPSIKGYSGLGSILLQLVKGTCSERVSTDETRLPSLLGVVRGQLI